MSQRRGPIHIKGPQAHIAKRSLVKTALSTSNRTSLRSQSQYDNIASSLITQSCRSLLTGAQTSFTLLSSSTGSSISSSEMQATKLFGYKPTLTSQEMALVHQFARLRSSSSRYDYHDDDDDRDGRISKKKKKKYNSNTSHDPNDMIFNDMDITQEESMLRATQNIVVDDVLDNNGYSDEFSSDNFKVDLSTSSTNNRVRFSHDGQLEVNSEFVSPDPSQAKPSKRYQKMKKSHDTDSDNDDRYSSTSSSKRKKKSTFLLGGADDDYDDSNSLFHFNGLDLEGKLTSRIRSSIYPGYEQYFSHFIPSVYWPTPVFETEKKSKKRSRKEKYNNNENDQDDDTHIPPVGDSLNQLKKSSIFQSGAVLSSQEHHIDNDDNTTTNNNNDDPQHLISTLQHEETQHEKHHKSISSEHVLSRMNNIQVSSLFRDYSTSMEDLASIDVEQVDDPEDFFNQYTSLHSIIRVDNPYEPMKMTSNEFKELDIPHALHSLLVEKPSDQESLQSSPPPTRLFLHRTLFMINLVRNYNIQSDIISYHFRTYIAQHGHEPDATTFIGTILQQCMKKCRLGLYFLLQVDLIDLGYTQLTKSEVVGKMLRAYVSYVRDISDVQRATGIPYDGFPADYNKLLEFLYTALYTVRQQDIELPEGLILDFYLSTNDDQQILRIIKRLMKDLGPDSFLLQSVVNKVIAYTTKQHRTEQTLLLFQQCQQMGVQFDWLTHVYIARTLSRTDVNVLNTFINNILHAQSTSLSSHFINTFLPDMLLTIQIPKILSYSSYLDSIKMNQPDALHYNGELPSLVTNTDVDTFHTLLHRLQATCLNIQKKVLDHKLLPHGLHEKLSIHSMIIDGKRQLWTHHIPPHILSDLDENDVKLLQLYTKYEWIIQSTTPDIIKFAGSISTTSAIQQRFSSEPVWAKDTVFGQEWKSHSSKYMDTILAPFSIEDSHEFNRLSSLFDYDDKYIIFKHHVPSLSHFNALFRSVVRLDIPLNRVFFSRIINVSQKTQLHDMSIRSANLAAMLRIPFDSSNMTSLTISLLQSGQHSTAIKYIKARKSPSFDGQTLAIMSHASSVQNPVVTIAILSKLMTSLSQLKDIKLKPVPYSDDGYDDDADNSSKPLKHTISKEKDGNDSIPTNNTSHYQTPSHNMIVPSSSLTSLPSNLPIHEFSIPGSTQSNLISSTLFFKVFDYGLSTLSKSPDIRHKQSIITLLTNLEILRPTLDIVFAGSPPRSYTRLLILGIDAARSSNNDDMIRYFRSIISRYDPTFILDKYGEKPSKPRARVAAKTVVGF